MRRIRVDWLSMMLLYAVLGSAMVYVVFAMAAHWLGF